MAIRQNTEALTEAQNATRERFSADPHAHQLGLALDDPQTLDTLARESEAATPIYAATLRASRESQPRPEPEKPAATPAQGRPAQQRPGTKKNSKTP